MTDSNRSQRVTFIVLRFMRKPILVLVSVYAVSMAGWVVIPGADVEGQQQPLSFFHAFYFLTYTATTTGFGEIPTTFSDAQRMWSIVSLYAGVIAWLYAVGAIIRLLQNPHFQQATAERRFANTVARIREPFVIICGFGNTGSLLARGLSDAGVTAVMLDHDDDRIKALQLRDYRVAMPGLQADALLPDRLLDAGLLKPNCDAVVALTGDEHVNLKVAVSARLLNPSVEVITHSTSATYEETIATLGGNTHIVDPFQTYARYLAAAIENPGIDILNRWLVGESDATLDDSAALPRGTWILCGYGRMGRSIRQGLESVGIHTAVIEPDFQGDPEEVPGLVVAPANQAALRAAGIGEAVGIVAGTDDDAYNLSIILNARALRPDIFVVVRQNRHVNKVLFDAAGAQLIMQPSLVSARRINFQLIAPLLRSVFDRVRQAGSDSGDDFIERLFATLRAEVGNEPAPKLWTIAVGERESPALARLLAAGEPMRLADILADPMERGRRLPCVPLIARLDGKLEVLPALERRLGNGDEILFCGRARAARLLEASLHDEYTLRYLKTGRDEPRGYIGRWLSRSLPRPAPDAAD